MIVFNWSEIQRIANNDVAAIVILTYAQTKRYNESLVWRGGSLLEKLHINHIPSRLFQTGVLSYHRGQVHCSYKTREPQSYIKNTAFLSYNASAYDKAIYIRALAHRKMTDRSDKIPRIFLSDKITYNPFFTMDSDYIYFNYESLK